MFAEDREPDTPEEETPESGAPGPEIEGADALSAAGEAAEQAAAEGEEAAGQGEDAPAEGEDAAPAGDEAPAEAQEAPAEGGDAAAGEGEDAPAAEGEGEAAVAAEGEAAPAEDEAARDRRSRRDRDDKPEEEVIPGMHLEPDLVLEEQREENEFGQYADADSYGDDASGEETEDASGEPEPVAYTPLDLAADARYNATGKRKSAVARVILKPGEGTYSINGRHLDEYFPRVRLQRIACQPLETAGYNTRMDVIARIHGGGVAAQATALRHGIARALVEADPALRGELKKRGYLTRDPRVKERKKAGLKKARKRPQFSKR